MTRARTPQKPAGDALAANLRLLCSFYGSISNTCRSLGVNRSQFNRYLSGAARPSRHLLMRICDFFGVEPEELELSPDHFQRLVSVRRKPEETRSPLADAVHALQQRSGDELDKYLGFYFKYYYSMSSPGAILRGLVCVYRHEGAVYYRRAERFPRASASGSTFRCHYSGAVVSLDGRIFLVDREVLTQNEVTETILYPTHRNRVSRLSGLVLGVSSRADRRIACSRVLLEWLGTTINVRRALRQCGLFKASSAEIDDSVKQAIDNRGGPAEQLFLARPL
ncbi:MAG TPA: helix-turn-helix transcriptional regulator [Burkholderiaceae bacterium]|nr:helix-turn-helix transcriptional regulator [Burkholderiaceae bacterium]